MIAFIVAVRKRPTVTKGWIGVWKKRNTGVGNAFGAIFADFRKANERRTRAVIRKRYEGQQERDESCDSETLRRPTREGREL